MSTGGCGRRRMRHRWLHDRPRPGTRSAWPSLVAHKDRPLQCDRCNGGTSGSLDEAAHANLLSSPRAVGRRKRLVPGLMVLWPPAPRRIVLRCSWCAHGRIPVGALAPGRLGSQTRGADPWAVAKRPDCPIEFVVLGARIGGFFASERSHGSAPHDGGRSRVSGCCMCFGPKARSSCGGYGCPVWRSRSDSGRSAGADARGQGALGCSGTRTHARRSAIATGDRRYELGQGHA